MSHLLHLIEQYGLAMVFINVLLEQVGLPLPAYPTLIISGALLSQGDYASAALLLLTAVVASLIADTSWYRAGRRYGKRVMAMLCKISLSPDSCVRQTSSIYTRWGAPSLMVAKFIPGFASIASGMAGTIGTRQSAFIFFDAIGAALWAGLAIYLGTLFSTTVDDLLNVLLTLGKWGSFLILAAFVAYIASKWWQRTRFLKSLHMARISVEELRLMLEEGNAPFIVDVRLPASQQAGRIPGAVVISNNDVNSLILDAPLDGEIIVYCECPNEASAAKVAKYLMGKGYTRVRPLTGGINAWIAAGHGIEKE
ncbi:MAG: rhodanese-like domain-containing protein [Methylophilaceae bacterium]